MASKTWNVGIVGYGFSAKIFHIPFVAEVPQFKLYAIVQRTPKPEDDAEKDHPGVKSYRTAEDMIKDAAVDVVIITTAPDSHYALAKLALENGKHVVCEKPFTPTSEEANDLVTLAQQQNRLLAVYQNRRFDADFVTLTKLVKNGSLGRVVEFETHFDRHRPEEPAADVSKWKNKVIPGGSAIYDLGSHLLDQAVQLMGMPDRITGFVGSQRAVNTTGFEDSFTVLLHYNNGLLVTAKAGVVSPEEKQLRYWVRGEKGSFKKFHLDIQEDQLKAGMRPGDNGYAREPSDRYGTLTTIQDGKPVAEIFPTVEPPTYTEYYRKLARALAGEGDLPASGAEAAKVIRLIELAKESSKLGKTIDV
ncbi:putative NAD binding Rossmann fold oxidoreductase [Aspergillus fischeri NRRL 181]|uniref:NAD binding Rossmann fold oxidoreductase, putative n=1 Tax=Neosartorya fischeri (strain ATCC 1020 / DSM 3700 / CBS 544.65 / FGSC A1164 / JCM 1740 / NRRL 181 / WB 181) TaxID=331117 RepID=A1DFC7_NEOFI|nr:NAD binding Rossmann fold oxidoreductase, putative [Aspergillus fischeri NRRL 181]EAW18084.1 NAD binding Rossmann fold oxidoreductase, putative [Aspergillus fischeri NRRL 181]